MTQTGITAGIIFCKIVFLQFVSDANESSIYFMASQAGKLLSSHKKMGPASDAKQRDPPRDEVRREGERTSSPRPQIAKQNRTAGEPAPRDLLCSRWGIKLNPRKFGGCVGGSKRVGRGGTGLRPAPRRGRDLAKRGEAPK